MGDLHPAVVESFSASGGRASRSNKGITCGESDFIAAVRRLDPLADTPTVPPLDPYIPRIAPPPLALGGSHLRSRGAPPPCLCLRGAHAPAHHRGACSRNQPRARAAEGMRAGGWGRGWGKGSGRRRVDGGDQCKRCGRVEEGGELEDWEQGAGQVCTDDVARAYALMTWHVHMH